MGYAQALLARDVYDEKKELEAQARKKDLWSGLGRTIGTLAALGITGGMAAPWVAAAWAGGLTAAGGAAGSFAAGGIEKGDFFKGERKELRKRLDPLGEENIVGGLSAAVTAGLGQKLKMAKDVSAAQRVLPEGATAADFAKAKEGVESGYKGLDFAGSTIGKTKVGQWLVGRGRPPTLDISDGIESGAFWGGPPDETLVTKRKLPELEPELKQTMLEPDGGSAGEFGVQTVEDQDKAWRKWEEELERQKKVYWSSSYEE